MTDDPPVEASPVASSTGAVLRRRPAIRFRLWARRVGLERKLAFALTALAVLAGIVTGAALTGASAVVGPDPKRLLALLYADGVLLILLAVLVVRRIVKVWAARRRGAAGSRLHVRFVVLFSLVAATPTVMVAVFSALFLNFGLQAWFSERVQTAIEQSHAVATAYLHEHAKTIRADAMAMVRDLDMEAASLALNPTAFSDAVSNLAYLRSLSEAVVINASGRVLAKAPLSFALEFERAPAWAISRAAQGEAVVLTSDGDARVRAVVRLNGFQDAFLLVGRLVDGKVLEHIEQTASAVAQYKRLESQRNKLQITFVMFFVVVALLVLLAAVWTGLSIATRLAQPVIALIGAAERVRKGDLQVRVDDSDAVDEIGALSRAFNRMTGQLETQQEGLMAANRELDERRRFTETVLTGVSAGVIGLDADGRVHLPNRSATELLGIDVAGEIGRPLSEVVPEFAPQMAEIMQRPDRIQQGEVKFRRGDQIHILMASVAAERSGNEVLGYVVTFDDVTELFSAQRKAAWADVARRIAHEIKNPLTPIQLAAERLKRKYLKEISTDPEVFSTCTDTIIRQVGDIGRMVDEFSAFARMPQATLRPENLSEICLQAVFLERNRHPEIAYSIQAPDGPVRLRCDSRQIGQAMTNLLKNAAESITGREPIEGETLVPGEISVTIDPEAGDAAAPAIAVVIADNGKGLPKEDRHRLTEPYVTTRGKGTGLGLAIVKKIMEDHNGDLVLEDREGGGARVILVFRPGEGEESASPAEDGERDPMTVATSILPTAGS
jgi:two-component system nitrogen regulation sensor histidine kinase NtrY